MATEVMRRQASDNEYVHKDFHGALSAAIEYLDERYGEEAVRDYLREFTTTFYAPLVREIAERGLAPLRDHFQRVYGREGGAAELRLTEDELVIRVRACPAVTHMRENGYPVARLWVETTRTVNEALCEGTPFAAELVEYDEQTGGSVQRFLRRAA
jgi:predicted ArsR family transcriptional regulator